MPRFSQITKKLITEAVTTDDLNDALFRFQNAIGIDSGDIAGVVFTGVWDDEWPLATIKRRREMMDHYISVERSSAGP
jgi:hypothetical protein